jgi:hypothetical protein
MVTVGSLMTVVSFVLFASCMVAILNLIFSILFIIFPYSRVLLFRSYFVRTKTGDFKTIGNFLSKNGFGRCQAMFSFSQEMPVSDVLHVMAILNEDDDNRDDGLYGVLIDVISAAKWICGWLWFGYGNSIHLVLKVIFVVIAKVIAKCFGITFTWTDVGKRFLYHLQPFKKIFFMVCDSVCKFFDSLKRCCVGFLPWWNSLYGDEVGASGVEGGSGNDLALSSGVGSGNDLPSSSGVGSGNDLPLSSGVGSGNNLPSSSGVGSGNDLPSSSGVGSGNNLALSSGVGSGNDLPSSSGVGSGNDLPSSSGVESGSGNDPTSSSGVESGSGNDPTSSTVPKRKAPWMRH